MNEPVRGWNQPVPFEESVSRFMRTPMEVREVSLEELAEEAGRACHGGEANAQGSSPGKEAPAAPPRARLPLR